MTMSTYEIYAAIVVLSIAGLLWALAKSSATFNKPDPCFTCNKPDACGGCIYREVKSAYVQRSEYSKVVATCTLTFKEEFVIAQSPAGGDEKWEIPNFVGCYKTTVAKWVDAKEAPIDNRIVSFG